MLHPFERVMSTCKPDSVVNMRTVAVISQKGNTGKTTLAIHLAAAASASGYVALVVDTDPQATACTWHTWRGDSDPE